MPEHNLYFWIILIAIIVIFLLDLVSEWLNLKALKPELPKEFGDVFDSDKYLQSQSYTRTTTRFGFLASTYGLVLFLTFWLIGGFNWLNSTICAWGFGEVTCILCGDFFVCCALLLVCLCSAVFLS